MLTHGKRSTNRLLALAALIALPSQLYQILLEGFAL